MSSGGRTSYQDPDQKLMTITIRKMMVITVMMMMQYDYDHFKKIVKTTPSTESMSMMMMLKYQP